MKTTKTNVRSRGTRIALAATLVAAAALAFSGDALAGGKHKHFKSHGHGHGHSHGAVVYVPAPVRIAPIVVPTRIYAKKAYRYDPYFVENAWYGPHRHVHAVYRFPVETRHGIVYRPYGYCDGHLVEEVYLPAPRPRGYVTFGGENFRIGIGF